MFPYSSFKARCLNLTYGSMLLSSSNLLSSILLFVSHLIKPSINLNMSQYYKELFSSIFPVAFISTPFGSIFLFPFYEGGPIVSLLFEWDFMYS